jgi:hypothetical protein
MASVNRSFMHQTSFDSATPSGPAVVAHQLTTPGDFEVVVARDDSAMRRIPLRVEARSENLEEPEPRPPSNVPVGMVAEVDPVALVRDPAVRRRGFRVFVDGYLSFKTGRPHGYRCYVTNAGGSTDGLEFDSTELGPSDIYAQTLVRPGRYSVTNALTEVRADLTVSYPKLEPTPYQPPDPLRVTCREEGFGQDPMELSPVQCVIFELDSPARILIELTEPDDGPSPEPSRKGTGRSLPRARGGRDEDVAGQDHRE